MTRVRPTRSAVATWSLVALITLAGAVLRLIYIGKVQTDPFYDAAVRSMGLSWHNFFFGAFDPSGATSIDKPPVDLWVQVAFVKVLGFSSTTLKLPEALAGIVSIPLLFAAVRRAWPTGSHGGAGSASAATSNTVAGLAAAAALALTPVEVITSRSDTMDGLMMALIVLALYLTVRACETGGWPWLLGAAAALGIAFDVKLLESLVALPGLALLAWFGLPGSRRRRIAQSLAAAAVYVVVALAWLTATLAFPAHSRPYAIGSTNGSAWNAAFVFNGTERLGPKAPEPGQTVYESSKHYPTATQSDRDHIPIVPPSPTRLLATIGPLSGERLGLELLLGLLLGIPALACGVLADRRALAGSGGGSRELSPRPPAANDSREPRISDPRAPRISDPRAPRISDPRVPRIRFAMTVGLLVWVLTGTVLFSHMIRLHPRYVEGFVPAVAALLGIGVAWAGSPAAPERDFPRLRLIALTIALLATVFYVERLEYGPTAIWWVSLVTALIALGLALTAYAGRASAHARSLSIALIFFTLVAVLVLPLRADIAAIHDYVSDAGYVGGIPREQLQRISSYLRAHRDGAHYEVAASSATSIGALIVKDVQPVVILTTYDARVFTDVAQLQRLIATGEVRYAFLNTFCTDEPNFFTTNSGCSTPVRWIRAHGTDVSHAAGLKQGGILYLLPGAQP